MSDNHIALASRFSFTHLNDSATSYVIHVIFIFKAKAIMRLLTQLIPWDRRKIPAASSLLTREKVALPQKNGPRVRTPYPNLMNLVSEKNTLFNTTKINGNWHSIKNHVEITDQNHSFWATLYRCNLQ